jgi:hypothetical protein
VRLQPELHLRVKQLVAHERQQRTDDQRRSCTPCSQQSRGDEVDRALAPSRPLDQEQLGSFVHEPVDRLPLIWAEPRIVPDSLSQQRVCVLGCNSPIDPFTSRRRRRLFDRWVPVQGLLRRSFERVRPLLPEVADRRQLIE